MRLREVLDQDRLLLVACHDCTSRTPLDPASFALRLGTHTEVADLGHDVLCPVCGSADNTLGVFSPVEKRERVGASSADVAP
jgi:hypothetical protein